MSTTRIYIVMQGEERRLVEAASAAQAIRHCVRNVYQAKPATPKDVARNLAAGVAVEYAVEDSETILRRKNEQTNTDTGVCI